MLLLWIAIFIVSLAILVKGADWLLESSQKIGLVLGMSPFIIGVLIIGFGTSLPELISSLAAVLGGFTEIVPANAVGSNITNILLVVGLSTIIGRRLSTKRNLIYTDLPLISIATILFFVVAWDRKIIFAESIILLAAYAAYIAYTFLHKRRRGVKINDIKKEVLSKKDFVLLAAGIVSLAIGSKYLIESVVNLSEILSIGMGVVALGAVAFGTSLPELFVSVKATWQKKPDIALGNIFGSNVFNLMVVIGIPGLFRTLIVDEKTFYFGLPVMVVATLLFVILGISKKIYIWEGIMYLTLYIFFISFLYWQTF